MEIWLKNKNQENKNYDKNVKKRYFTGNEKYFLWLIRYFIRSM